jgi:predicted nuclease of predicted toxin-antitoxin system
MRFLADMGISIEVVAALRGDGHEATHLNDEGLHRLSDNDILDKAVKEQRVLLTHDLDFNRMLALLHGTAPSIISFRLRRMTPANVLSRLRVVIQRLGEELSAGAVVSVRDGDARFRRLPLIHDEGSGEPSAPEP